MSHWTWKGALRFLIGVAYLTTNVVFAHSVERNFWKERRDASRKADAARRAPTSATDALVLAQLPGGVRFDVRPPLETGITPKVAGEHLVGGKIPVFAEDLPRWISDVVSPYGNVRDAYLSKRPGAPLVVHIQDLHDSAEAQKNIADLVAALQDERGVSLVGLEGAQGAFATEAFRSFPDAEITKSVATFFMDQGYLGGPEFAGITSKRAPLLWGVEEMAGYNSNVDAVKRSARNRPAMEGFLSDARGLMAQIKNKNLSAVLLEFDQRWTGYHSRREPLGAYVRYLLNNNPLRDSAVPNLILLRDALHWEDTLDFRRIELERTDLVEKMVKNLSKAALNRLVGKSALYRLGRITYGEYYRFLRDHCEENGISLAAYPQLGSYVRYVLLAERINRNDLLNEMTLLEREVQDSLTQTPKERRVVDSSRNLALMERLVKHGYTPADWAYHITHENEIRHVGVTVQLLAREEGLPESLSPPSMELLKPFEDFCVQALGRNGAMVKNLLEKMTAERRTTAVLVAGGFHTEGMTQLLRQKDVSYAVVTPKLKGDLPEGQRSLDLLARDPAPLEKLFAGETVNIPTQRIVGDSSGGNPLAQRLRTLFGALLLALSVSATNADVTPSSPAGQSAARIAATYQISATPQGNAGVEVTSTDWKGKQRVVQISPAGPKSPGAVTVGGYRFSIAEKKPGDFVGNIFKWTRAQFFDVKNGWSVFRNWTAGLVKGFKINSLGMGVLFAGLTFPSLAFGATLDVLSVSPLIPPGIWPFAVILGMGAILVGALRSKVLQPLAIQVSNRLTEFRNQAPILYYSSIGIVKTLLFAATGFLVVPDLFLSFAYNPLISWAMGFLWAVPVQWMWVPFGRAFTKGKNLKSVFVLLKRDLTMHRQTDRWTNTRLSAAFGAFGVFAVGLWLPLIGGFWTALALSSGFTVARDLSSRSKPKGDPFIPSILGYLGMAWILLTTPAARVHFLAGDGDDFGALNGALGKELVGTVPGARAESVVFSKRSLFWERRRWLADLAWSVRRTRIIKGVGGDEYLGVSVGTSDEVGNGLSNVVEQFNQRGVVNGGPKEAFFRISAELNEGAISNLKKWSPSIALIKHEGQYKLSIDRSSSPSKSIDEWKSELAKLINIPTEEVSEITLVGARNLAAFTTSMGIVNGNDVLSILAKIEGVGENEWVSSSGYVRWSKIPEVVLWGYRFASDALSAAKKGELDENNQERKKNRVYMASPEALQQILSAYVDVLANVQSARKNWWRGLFKFGRSGIDRLSKTLTPATFHARLARANPPYLYRLDIARYRNVGETVFTPRGFHELQGNSYAFGNAVINTVAEVIRTKLARKGFLSRAGPDTYFLAANEKLSPEEIQTISNNINNKLNSVWRNYHWSVFLAVYEVARPDDISNGEEWPFSGLAKLNPFADAIKAKGENSKNIEGIGLEDISSHELAGINAFLAGFPTDPIKGTKLNKAIIEGEQFKAEESQNKLQTSSQSKTTRLNENISNSQEGDQKPAPNLAHRLHDAFLMPIYELPFIPFLALGLTWGVSLVGLPWWVGIILGSGLMARFHGKPESVRGPPNWADLSKRGAQTYGQFIARFGAALAINTLALSLAGVPLDSFFQAMPFDLSTVDYPQLIKSAYLSHSVYNFFVPEKYRLSLGVKGQSARIGTPTRSFDPQISIESDLVQKKKESLVKEIESLGGVRLKIFHEISSLRFLPPSRNAEDQIQNYMDRILRQLALSGATSKSRQVADIVLLEAVFYEKLAALQDLINRKKREAIFYMAASDREMVRTAALIFVPLASRLGWNGMADQIADLAYELLDPIGHDRVESDLLDGIGFNSLNEMDRHAVSLQEKIEEATKKLLGSHVDVRVRRKRLYSIAAKMKNKPDRYRSARDVTDAFNAVVVFNKRRQESWAISQGLLYNQIYAVLQANPIDGYKDGRDPKDSYEPKGREDTHVLFKTDSGFVEVQFKSWDVFKEYKSKGQVTDRWKKPAHWIYKTKSILKALYGVEDIDLESDSFELTGDVGKNLDEVVRSLLVSEFPAITGTLGTEMRVVKIATGRRVLDLVAHPESGFGLDEIPKVKAQRPNDRRTVGYETSIQSADIYSLIKNGNPTNNPLPSEQYSLRVRLALLQDAQRTAGLKKANDELRELLPAEMRPQGVLESLINLLTFSSRRADHRRDMFLTTGRAIATRNGLVSLEELLTAWGTGLLSSEDLGRDIYDEGKQILSEYRLGLEDPNVALGFQSMVEESEEIQGMLVALPPILGKCSEMLFNGHPDQLNNKDMYKLVLGISLGLISIESVLANFPSVSVEDKKVGHKHEFTIRGSDRVGFIFRIIQLLNQHEATVDHILAPPADTSGNETAIKVVVHVKPENIETLRSALGSIPAAESGPMPSANARLYRLRILHEPGMKPLENALEVLENFEANITEVPIPGFGERIIDFRLNPRQLAPLQQGLVNKASILGDDFFFSVEELPKPANSTNIGLLSFVPLLGLTVGLALISFLLDAQFFNLAHAASFSDAPSHLTNTILAMTGVVSGGGTAAAVRNSSIVSQERVDQFNALFEILRQKVALGSKSNQKQVLSGLREFLKAGVSTNESDTLREIEKNLYKNLNPLSDEQLSPKNRNTVKRMIKAQRFFADVLAVLRSASDLQGSSTDRNNDLNALKRRANSLKQELAGEDLLASRMARVLLGVLENIIGNKKSFQDINWNDLTSLVNMAEHVAKGLPSNFPRMRWLSGGPLLSRQIQRYAILGGATRDDFGGIVGLIDSTARTVESEVQQAKQNMDVKNMGISFFGVFPLPALMTRYLTELAGNNLPTIPEDHFHIPETSEVLLNILKAAGFAVSPEKGFAQSINLAVIRINDSRINSQNIDVLNGDFVGDGEGDLNNQISNDKFVTAISDQDGQVHVVVHKETLEQWAILENDHYEKYKGLVVTMIEAALRHELAELDGVPHQVLVDLGLDFNGVKSLYDGGAKDTQVGEIVRRQYELAKVSRLISRTARAYVATDQEKASQANEIVDSFFPPSKIFSLAREVTLDSIRIGEVNDKESLLKSIGRVERKASDKKPKYWLNLIGQTPSEMETNLANKLALREYDGGNNIRLARNNLSRDILRFMGEYLEGKLSVSEKGTAINNLYRLVGLLHTMGGSLSLADTGYSSEFVELGANLQPALEDLDIKFLGEVGAALFEGKTVENLAAILNKGAEGYDSVRWAGIRIRNYKHVVEQALATNGEFFIHVTKNMLSQTAELTPAERTQLLLIHEIDRRLQSAGAQKKITFLLDRDVNESNKRDLLPRIENGIRRIRPTADIRNILGDNGAISLPVVNLISLNKYVSTNESKTIINAENILDDAKTTSPYLFRVDQPAVEWELGAWAQRLVAHIVALMGDLVVDQSRHIPEERNRQRFLRFQA